MPSRRTPRQVLVAVLFGVLIGGGLMAITPAGAEISQAASTNWKKIWKKKLKPLADKRYYTKRQSGATFSTKTESAAAAAAAKAAAEAAANAATDAKLGNYDTRAQGDAKLGGYYTKAQADAKYAPAQPLYRGTYLLFGYATGAQQADSASVSFGATFPVAPTAHYIKAGAVIPAGCSGTSAAPNAAAGHFCVFESYNSNVGTNRRTCRGGGSVVCEAADPFGASIFTYSAAAGSFSVYGTWAARPSGPVANPAFAPAPEGAVNSVDSGQGSPTES